MGMINGLLSLLLLLSTMIKPRNFTTHDNLLSDLIESSSKVAKFFDKNSLRSNLDGLFGIRVSEEQLAAFLEKISQKCLAHEIMNLKDTIDKLVRLQHRLRNISAVAIPRLKTKNPSYFKQMSFIFKKDMWKFVSPMQNTDAELIYREDKLNFTQVTETFSDICMSQWNHEGCKISNKCWKFATELYRNGYHITHQYIFLLIGKLKGCLQGNDEVFKKSDKKLSVDHLIAIFCTNILKESQLFEDEYFPVWKRDLFMEQVGLCGLSGYHPFFNSKWIRKIMSWQKPSGCFGTGSFAIRKKREDVDMPGGCSAHITTVALMALQQSIRYLLEPQLQRKCKMWM